MAPLFFKKAKIILVSAFLASLIITLWSALLLPVYVDEVQWKLTVSRYFLDGGMLIYLFPACEKGYLLPIPITWYPGRLLDSFLYGDASNFKKLRLYGWTIFIGLIFLWSWLLHRLSHISKFNSFLFISAFLSIGMLPYLMVLNRPEQSLLLWISIALGANLFISSKINISCFIRILVLIIFMLLGSLIASSHPKGIFFFPLLFIIYRQREKSLLFLVTYFSVLALVTSETISLWNLRTFCEESPWLTKLISQFTLQPQLLINKPLEFFMAGFENFKRFPEYLDPIAFHKDYPSQWFLATPLVELFPIFFWIVGYLVPLLIICLSLLTTFQINWKSATFNAIRNALVNKKEMTQWGLPLFVAITLIYVDRWPWAVVIIAYAITPMYSGRWVLPKGKYLLLKTYGISPIKFGIILTVLLLCFMQTLKNFYEISLLWPLLLLFFIYSTSFLSIARKKWIINIYLPWLLVIGVGYSLIRIVVAYDLPVMKFNVNETEIDKKEKIKLFAKNKCNITEESYPLILDDQTYSIYWSRSYPLHVSYVFGWWSTGTKPSETIARRNPAGLIINSYSLSPEITKNFLCEDGLCCMSKSGLQLIK